MSKDELEGKGLFAQRQAEGDPQGGRASLRIQQLQQQLEAWEALLEKLGGNERSLVLMPSRPVIGWGGSLSQR